MTATAADLGLNLPIPTPICADMAKAKLLDHIDSKQQIEAEKGKSKEALHSPAAATELDVGSSPMELVQSSSSASYWTPSEYRTSAGNGRFMPAKSAEDSSTPSWRDKIRTHVSRGDSAAPATAQSKNHFSTNDKDNGGEAGELSTFWDSDSVEGYLGIAPELMPFDFNWTELRELGHGAFGQVSIATRNPRSLSFTPSDKGKFYAVKRSNNAGLDNTGLGSLFMERQNNWLACMDSSSKSINLFAFMSDYDKASTYPTWLSMPYYEGPTLWQTQLNFGWLPASFVLDIAEDLLDALEWLHAPRDLKPAMAHGDLHASNVLVDMSRPVPATRFPHIRILDLGLAHHAYSFDDAAKQTTLQAKQHSDIHDFGQLVHDLAHQDQRGLGRGNRKPLLATSHCFSSLDKGRCPYMCDPYTQQLFNEHDPYWTLINHCTFIKYGETLCPLRSDNLIHDIKVQLVPYISDRRNFYFHHYILDEGLKVLQWLLKPLPDLPPEHQPTPPPPSPIVVDSTPPLTHSSSLDPPSSPPFDEAWEQEVLWTYGPALNKRRFEDIADTEVVIALRAKRPRY